MRYLFFILVFTVMSAAQAAEPVPGDACSTAGATLAGNNGGTGHFMLCQGGTWKAVYSYNATGNLTKIGNLSCAANEILKFNGSVWACAADATGSGTLPTGCTLPGAQCDDGSVLAGVHNHRTLYVTDANLGAPSWATVNQNNTGARSFDDGKANQAWIAANRTLSQYPAFELCENLVRHGHDDWYLPAPDELNILYGSASTAIGIQNDGYFWSSAEAVSTSAWQLDLGTIDQVDVPKASTALVRCFRKP